MIVVAIIGVLASMAVYLFGSQKKRVEATTEVTVVFTELRVKQEQFRLENGSFLSTGTSEPDLYPPSSPATDGGKVALPSPATGDMLTLRFAPDIQATRCGYVSIAGEGGDATNVGSVASSEFSYVPPAVDWYYLLAQCDMDQDSTVDSFYFQHSEDSKLYYINQGK